MLTLHPICRRCQLSGRIVAAVIGHHLHEVSERPELRLVVANGVGVCETCHNGIHRIGGEVERFREQMRQMGYGVADPPKPTSASEHRGDVGGG